MEDKLAVSNMLTRRDISFITMTDTGQGLWVTCGRARGGLRNIIVNVTFPRTMTKYSIPQGGNSQNKGDWREEADVP